MSFKAPTRLGRVACNAGANPKIAPAATDTARENSNTRQSTPTSSRERKIDRRSERQQHLQDPDCKQHAGSATDKRKQNAFSEKLPDQTQAVRAHRQTDRDLFAAIGRTREHESGEIGARHEQHQSHRRHHHPGKTNNRTAQVRQDKTRWIDLDRLSFVGVRILFRELLAQQVERSFGLACIDSVSSDVR